MKTLIVLCAFVLLSLAQQEGYHYTVPATRCSWSMTEEYIGPNTYYKRKHYVFGAYYKSETYNKNGDLIGAFCERADYAYKGISAYFTYDGTSCTVRYGSSSGRSLQSILGYYHTMNKHINETKYNGHKCMVYYNNSREYGFPDVNEAALYVDMEGYVIGDVRYANDTLRREVTNYTYGSTVTMGDFTFSKGYCYSCSDERIFHNPSAYYAQCSASTSSAAIAVVLAALVAALVSLF